MRQVMQSPPFVCLSVRPFVSISLVNRLNVDFELLRVSRGLKVKVKVKVMGQVNAVGPISIEGIFQLLLFNVSIEETDGQIPLMNTLLVREENGSMKLLVGRNETHAD